MSDTMLGLSQPLQTLVSSTFSRALQTKDIVFSQTSLAILKSKSGIPYQLRYCPALAKKAKEAAAAAATATASEVDSSEAADKKPKRDPFENPAAELLLASIPHPDVSHTLLLNKFPVIHNHFIIATKLNKPQTAVLEEDDISLTYACLRAWNDETRARADGRLFAFFNSGEHSGASQPHRHLQFLPVEDIVGQSDEEDFSILIDNMTVPAHPSLPLYQDPSFPLLHFATPLDSEISAESLHAKYILLLKAALCASQRPGRPFDEQTGVEKDGTAVFSYNLAMTLDRMAICPRKQETFGIPAAGADSSVAPNGTLLAGTLMVKEKAEWEVLRADPSMLDDLLTSLGFAPQSWEA